MARRFRFGFLACSIKVSTKPTKEGDGYGVRWATTLNYELPEIMAVIHQKGSDYMKTMKRLMMTFMALGLAMKESCIGFFDF